MLRFGPAISTRPFQPSCAAAIRALKGTLVAGLLLGLAACGGGGGDSGSFDSGGTPSSPPPSANITPIYALGSGSGSTYQDGVINASQTTLRAGESATLRRAGTALGATGPPTTQSPGWP